MLNFRPSWLVAASRYLGTHEVAGKHHNPLIVKWWAKIRAPFTDDETPWCAAFVGGVLEECGIKSTRSASARSYGAWGVRLTKPTPGAIVVLTRESDPRFGHVGFVVGKDRNNNLLLLGGNQGNAVSIKPFALERVLSYHWPLNYSVPSCELPVLRWDGTNWVN